MRNHARAHGVKRINMPRICSGLDGLRWKDVSKAIKKVFREETVNIRIYDLHTEDRTENMENIDEQEFHEETVDDDKTYEDVMIKLRQELLDANTIIEILNKRLNGEDFKNTAGVSEEVVQLIKTGKLSFSSMYTVMVQIESELKELKADNVEKSDLKRLSSIETDLKDIKSSFDKLQEEQEHIKVKYEEVEKALDHSVVIKAVNVEHEKSDTGDLEEIHKPASYSSIVGSCSLQ